MTDQYLFMIRFELSFLAFSDRSGEVLRKVGTHASMAWVLSGVTADPSKIRCLIIRRYLSKCSSK
jgi:hypothetical protein